MLLVALIPLSSSWFMNTRRTERDIAAGIEATLRKNSDLLVTQTDNWVDLNLRMLEYASRLDAIKSMDAERQNPLLEAMSDTYGWIYLAFTVSPDGQNVGRNDGKNAADFYFGDRRYFKQVMSGQSAGQQMLIGRTSGKPSLVLAKPVTDSAGGLAGIVAMSAQVREVSDAVVQTQVGQTGFAFLLDDQGRVIAHGHPDVLTNAPQDFSTHPALATDSQLFTFESDGKQVVAYAQKTQLGWTMVVQQDYDEAFAPLVRSRRAGRQLFAVTISLILISAFLLVRRLVHPLKNLTQAAENISRGNLEVKIAETERGDEIGALARAIDRLKVSIRIAVDELQKK